MLRILLASLFLANAASAQITWSERYYNPSPAEGDFTLPMPCGGAMVFRRVETPNADGAIGDVAVILGQEGGDQPFLDGLRRSYVSGAFREGGAPDGKPYFYMAKYELAQAQFDAVMSSTCPDEPRRRAFVPATEHSRLAYADFAERWTLWLMKNAPDALPSMADTRGYVRLPTEEEWEFAARGGLAVEDSLFRAPLPPISDGEEHSEYIAHGGSDSAGGKVQVIGTLKPNPLGLHDMLGNVAEVVGTPFALVRHGRLHGQAGGYVKRGGDARTPLSSITSATRFEVSPFDDISNEPTQDRYTGARMVIAGLSITSPEQAAALAEGLDRLAEIDAAMVSASSEEEVMAMIDDMAKAATSESERSRIAIIRETIERARAERNAQRDASIRLLIRSGTLICDQAVQRYLNALAINSMAGSFDALEAEAEAAGDEALLAEIEAERAFAQERLAALEERVDQEVVDYADLIEGLAKDYSMPLLRRQSEYVAPDIRAGGSRRAACLDRLTTHIAVRDQAGFSDIEMLALDLQGIARDEASE